MIEKLKQLDRKVYIMGGIILGAIVLLIIILIIIKLLAGPGNNYSKLEQKLVKAAQTYLKKNPDSVPQDGESIELDSATLVSSGSIGDLSKQIKDTCTGRVLVMNNGGSALYLPHLDCTNYTTVHFYDKVIEDNLVADSEDPYEGGLYEVNGEYIFRGKLVNNYISFGGLLWRIIKIDENGNLRVIKANAEKAKKIWDNKYNTEIEKSYGINEYENSFLRETLQKDYASITQEQNKIHLIPHDVCIGKRSDKNREISYDIDCSEVLEGEYISVINTLDFPMASLDENCTSVGAGSCVNYNYLSNTVTTSWTSIGSADNTYEVYDISGGYVNTLRARNTVSYYWVIYLSGQELYTTGSGTEQDPYIIK